MVLCFFYMVPQLLLQFFSFYSTFLHPFFSSSSASSNLSVPSYFTTFFMHYKCLPEVLCHFPIVPVFRLVTIFQSSFSMPRLPPLFRRQAGHFCSSRNSCIRLPTTRLTSPALLLHGFSFPILHPVLRAGTKFYQKTQGS